LPHSLQAFFGFMPSIYLEAVFIYCLTPKSVKQYGGAKRRPPRSGDKNGEFISPFLLEN